MLLGASCWGEGVSLWAAQAHNPALGPFKGHSEVENIVSQK